MFFVPPAPCGRADRAQLGAGAGASEDAAVEQENGYFAALKLFLVFGPLLGLAALELIVLRRDKRRAASGRPLVPARGGPDADVRGAVSSGARR